MAISLLGLVALQVAGRQNMSGTKSATLVTRAPPESVSFVAARHLGSPVVVVI
jgi:hypothetical protein